MISHHRVDRYCDLPDAVQLDGRVWRFQSLSFGSTRVGFTALGSLLLKTVDGGETWRYLGRLAPSGFGASEISSLGPMRAWVACTSTAGARPGRIPVLVTEDGGKHWDTAWAGDPSVKYGSKIDLFFVDDRTGWLTATAYTPDGQSGFIFGTTDSGAHWELVAGGLSVRPQAIIFRNAAEGYLLSATPDQDRKRAFSVDLHDGATKSEFLVGGNASVLLSLTEGGRKREPVMKTSSSLYAISGAASGTIFMCGSGGTILRSTEPGSTWERAKTGTRIDLNDICFTKRGAGTTGLAVGEDGVILGSTDEGKTWRKLQHAIGRRGFVAVEMFGASNAVIAASDAIYLLNLSDAPIADASQPLESVPM